MHARGRARRRIAGRVLVVLALLAGVTALASPAGAANPSYQAYLPPPGYSLEVNGSTGFHVLQDGDVVTFDLVDHAYNTCAEGPTIPGCLSNIQWNPWFDRSYENPRGNPDAWGYSWEILDPDNDCRSDDYSCTVQLTTTRTASCTGVPRIDNVSPLLISVSGDLGLGFGSSTLPYIIPMSLFVDFGAQDCPPLASLGWDTLGPKEIAFSGSGSYDPDNLDLSNPFDPVGPGDGIVSYSWDFGDGAISFDPDPVHVYTQPGYYDVTLTVTDDEGDVAMAIESIDVGGEVIADFTWSYPDFDNDPYTIEFDSSPTQSDAEIYNWDWDFGDEEFGCCDPFPTHTYAELGEVDVTLYVEDEFGGYDEITKTVDVGGDPPTTTVPVLDSPFGFLYDEGDAGSSTNALVPLQLSFATTGPVTVQWQTTELLSDPDRATIGEDYAADSGTTVIPAGATEASIPITVLGDDLDENDENAWVEITGVTGATLAPGAGFGFVVIADDDDPPVAQPVAAVIPEGDSGSTIGDLMVELSAPSALPVTIGYMLAPTDGVIMGGAQDFVPATGSITFDPGETSKPIPVEVLGDTTPEPGQLFGAEWGGALLTTSSNATLPGGWNKVAFFLIVDDDIAVAT